MALQVDRLAVAHTTPQDQIPAPFPSMLGLGDNVVIDPAAARMTPVQWEALKLNTSLVRCCKLQIGNWEIRNFLAKFLYDAKLFVWEFTEGNAKMRFEIPWMSISAMQFFRPRLNYKSALILDLNVPPQIFEGDKEAVTATGGTKWIRKSSRGLIVEQFRVHRLFFDMSLDIHVDVLKHVDARIKRMLLKGVPDILRDDGFALEQLPIQKKPVFVAKDQHHIKTIRALIDIDIDHGDIQSAIQLLNRYVLMHVDFRSASLHLNFPVHQALGCTFEEVPYLFGKEYARVFRENFDMPLAELKEQKQRLWSWWMAIHSPDHEGRGPFDEAIALLDEKIVKLVGERAEDGRERGGDGAGQGQGSYAKSSSTATGIRNFKPYHNLVTRTKIHQWAEVARRYVKKDQPLKALNVLKVITNLQVDRTILKRKEGERELRDNLNFLYDIGDLWNRVVRVDFRMTEVDIVELQRLLKRHSNELEKYGLAEPYDACPFSDAMGYLASRLKTEARSNQPHRAPLFASTVVLEAAQAHAQRSTGAVEAEQPPRGGAGAGGGAHGEFGAMGFQSVWRG